MQSGLSDYLPLFILLVLSSAVAGLVILISIVFGPKRRSHASRKVAPYESGMKAIGIGQRRFPVRFYLIAVLFILFDIEVIFFYPWAVSFRQLGLFGFFEMLVFIGILLVGYIWLWKKGALEWESMDKE
ncbi:MAG: NADH-quinone oxidoreductase subunit A [Chloroflexi bacterium]|nr:NADH-quinone oxidoreductase subunit A [Chloroflexota bacterium]MCL5274334.1 NADH-quinone oxidoreductase subunit A [Chloroflexota bacterium]